VHQLFASLAVYLALRLCFVANARNIPPPLLLSDVRKLAEIGQRRKGKVSSTFPT
jgi:hypothetical protein